MRKRGGRHGRPAMQRNAWQDCQTAATAQLPQLRKLGAHHQHTCATVSASAPSQRSAVMGPCSSLLTMPLDSSSITCAAEGGRGRQG